MASNNSLYHEDNCDCMILNFWSCVNYGASLTSYGTQCLMEKVGLKAKVINYRPQINLKYEGSFSQSFAEKYLNLTRPVCNYQDFLSLNNNCNLFVSGSDQVWNAGIMRSHASGVCENIYVLDFVDKKSKKISYAASFGADTFNGDIYQKEMFKHYVQQFDDISVREKEGQKILENDFGVSAIQLIDGAFHIPKETLSSMIGKESPNGKYLGVYTLPYFKSQNWYKGILEEASKALNLPIKYLEFDPKVSVADWLAFIKNAEFVITDSYHAVVFSIIFNRPFLQVKNAKTQSRFESLFSLLGIKNNSIGQEGTLADLNEIRSGFDWEKINGIIELERLRAESWLISAIKKDLNPQKSDNYINLFISQSVINTKKVNQSLYLIKHKGSIKWKYYFYSLMCRISFSKKRDKYKAMKDKYKALKRQLG